MKVAGTVAFGLVSAAPLRAQLLHPDGPRPSFEVATIRPTQQVLAPPPPLPPVAPRKAGPAKIAPGNGGGVTTEQFRTQMSGQLLIAFAYNVPFGFEDHLIVGAPAWLNSAQYEIKAKIEDSLFAAMQKRTPAQQREQVELMQQSLLADRFKLKVHFETREMAGYELVLAKGGSKLAPAMNDERSRLSETGTPQANRMVATATTIDQLIHSPFLNARMIVDHTGLTDAYDFTLTWASETLDAAAPDSPSDAPSLFTAVQEQLGLRLVPAKVPVEVIVIDHVEKPSQN